MRITWARNKKFFAVRVSGLDKGWVRAVVAFMRSEHGMPCSSTADSVEGLVSTREVARHVASEMATLLGATRRRGSLCPPKARDEGVFSGYPYTESRQEWACAAPKGMCAPVCNFRALVHDEEREDAGLRARLIDPLRRRKP